VRCGEEAKSTSAGKEEEARYARPSSWSTRGEGPEDKPLEVAELMRPCLLVERHSLVIGGRPASDLPVGVIIGGFAASRDCTLEGVVAFSCPLLKASQADPDAPRTEPPHRKAPCTHELVAEALADLEPGSRLGNG
jgi:hypothetical protein